MSGPSANPNPVVKILLARPSSAIEWARASSRFDFVKQPRGVRFTNGTLMPSWVISDAFGSGIRRALGTAAPTACTFAVGSAADGCRAAGPGAGALPPHRVPCIVSKYSPRFPPERKSRSGNAAKMAVSKTMAPVWSLSLKLAPAAVWPREPSERFRGSPRGPAVVPDRAAAHRATTGGTSPNRATGFGLARPDFN
jgi:hypothetical protein